MNSSRIRLSRIVAFNWYGFRTIIEVHTKIHSPYHFH